VKRWKCRKCVENFQRSGRPKKTDDRCDRHVKCHRKQTLQVITNTVSNFIPQSLTPRTVRRRLRSCGFTRRKILKSIVISRANRVRRVSSLSCTTNAWLDCLRATCSICYFFQFMSGEGRQKFGGRDVSAEAEIARYVRYL